MRLGDLEDGVDIAAINQFLRQRGRRQNGEYRGDHCGPGSAMHGL